MHLASGLDFRRGGVGHHHRFFLLSVQATLFGAPPFWMQSGVEKGAKRKEEEEERVDINLDARQTRAI